MFSVTLSLALSTSLASLVFAGVARSAEDGKKVWNFDDDKAGEIAKGFTNEAGKWVVADSD